MTIDIESLIIAIVEDEEAHFELMRRAVSKEIPSASIHYFQDPRGCLENLVELNPGVIIVDYVMPGMTGIEFLEAVGKAERTCRSLS